MLVVITPTIQKEFGKELPEWIRVKAPKDNHYQKILQMDLDEGESSAIALSLEFENSILIIDDLKARKIAEMLNLKFSGTFGLILKAKQLGFLKSVKPILVKIKSTNFRFSEELYNLILEESGE